MEIVHICLTGGYTEGINYQENYLTKYHALEGHRVTIITTQYCWNEGVWGTCLDSRYENQYGVQVIRIPYRWKLPYRINTYIGKFKGLYDYLSEIKPDFIFVHNFQFRDIKLIARYKDSHKGVRLAVDNHSDFSVSARNWLSRTLLYGIYWRSVVQSVQASADKLYGVLPARVDFMVNVYGIPREKCELLVMGADDEEVEKANHPENIKNFRKKYHIAGDDFLVMTGGKIDAFKRQTLLLMEVVRKIENPHVKLIIFGSVEPDLKEKFNQLVDGIKVQYMGWADGKQSYEFFAAADLVVFPGRHSVYWEQVVGLGIPMVCKYWEGTTHVDLGGNVVFLYEDSSGEIYKKVTDIANNPDQYQRMKKVAVEKGMEIFSYKKIAERSIS